MARYMDSLQDLSSTSSSLEEEGEEEGGKKGGNDVGTEKTKDETEAAKGSKAATAGKPKGITMETLKRLGYRAGPSVLLVPDETNEDQNWQWGNGKQHAKASKESALERENTRGAANELTTEAIKRGLEHAESLKKLKKKEWIAKKRVNRDDKSDYRDTKRNRTKGKTA